jgi:hypothetical protein
MEAAQALKVAQTKLHSLAQPLQVIDFCLERMRDLDKKDPLWPTMQMLYDQFEQIKVVVAETCRIVWDAMETEVLKGSTL